MKMMILYVIDRPYVRLSVCHTSGSDENV